MKPDLIVTWPRNCDYPLWRQMIHDNRERFAQVVVVFMETHFGHDYRQFLSEALSADWVTVGTSPATNGGDWRDVAVKHGLKLAVADWVWFTEQDFNPLPGYFDLIDKLSDHAWAIAAFDGPRMHPCSLYVKREYLENNRVDLAANPPHYDHFGRLQLDLEQSGQVITRIPEDSYTHMNGLSHNLRLVSEGGQPIYKPEEFNAYLEKSLQVTVSLSPVYTNMVKDYFNRYGVSEGK